MSRASDLPEGSVVANHRDCCIKHAPSAPYPWCTTKRMHHVATDDEVQAWLDGGAMVMRYGYEMEGRPDVGQPLPTEVEMIPRGKAVGRHAVIPDAVMGSS